MDLERRRIDRIVKFALKEDVGKGDVTSEVSVSRLTTADAVIICRDEGVLCGVEIAERVFASCDSSLRFRPAASDGEDIHPGQEVAYVEGYASSIMMAERTALNYLGMLSGVATETKKAVSKLRGSAAKLYDTRKTLPLNRYFQKYAVKCGGGENHRMGLWDMVLIKDNHLRAYSMQIRSNDSEKVIRGAIKQARATAQQNVPIEIEVENLAECEWALEEGPDIILLDNFSVDKVRAAVDLRKRKGKERDILLEASGGIGIDRIEKYAKCGIDRVSVGNLTSKITPLDYSLEIIYKHA